MMKSVSFLALTALSAWTLTAAAEPAAAPKFLYDSNPTHSAAQIVRVHESFTVTPQDGGAVEVAAAPSNAGYPGLSFVPAGGAETWDFSPWGFVSAKLTNLGEKPLSLSMRVDNNGDWRLSPWNAESVYLKPGEARVLKVFFGYQYGYQAGYALDPAAVSQVLIFLNGKAEHPRRFRVEELQAGGAAGDKPDSHYNAAHVPHDGKLFGGGATPLPRLETANGATARIEGDAILVAFEKPNGRVTLRPADAKPGVWNLRNFNQVDAALRNNGTAPASFRLTVESPAGPTDAAEVTLQPGEKRVLALSFIPKTPFKLVRNEANGKIETEKGTGTKFESNRANGFSIRADAGVSLALLGLRASAPAVELPAWSGKRPPVASGEWELTLNEEFNGETVDLNRWNIYTANFWDRRTHFSKDNVLVRDGKALLRYERKRGYHNDDPEDKSAVAHTDYACGFLDTYGKWTQLYGYFEARVKLPRAMGLWPAFWTMPDRGGVRDHEANPQWRRASTGDGGMEFDILEHLTAWGPYRFNSAFHWDGYGKNHKACGTSQVYCGADAEGFITVGMLWLPGYAAYYANGQKFLEWEDERVCSQPSYLILYMVSGGWANLPLDIQALPADFEIDYVRVWQRKDLMRPQDGPQPNEGGPRAQY